MLHSWRCRVPLDCTYFLRVSSILMYLFVYTIEVLLVHFPDTSARTVYTRRLWMMLRACGPMIEQ